MVRPEVIRYMEKAFLFKFDSEVTETSDLFKAGIIDSYGYIKLMQYIQTTFQIQFSKEELLSNVVTSLSGIVASVEAKLDRAREGGA